MIVIQAALTRDGDSNVALEGDATVLMDLNDLLLIRHALNLIPGNARTPGHARVRAALMLDKISNLID